MGIHFTYLAWVIIYSYSSLHVYTRRLLDRKKWMQKGSVLRDRLEYEVSHENLFVQRNFLFR